MPRSRQGVGVQVNALEAHHKQVLARIYAERGPAEDGWRVKELLAAGYRYACLLGALLRPCPLEATPLPQSTPVASERPHSSARSSLAAPVSAPPG